MELGKESLSPVGGAKTSWAESKRLPAPKAEGLGRITPKATFQSQGCPVFISVAVKKDLRKKQLALGGIWNYSSRLQVTTVGKS